MDRLSSHPLSPSAWVGRGSSYAHQAPTGPVLAGTRGSTRYNDISYTDIYIYIYSGKCVWGGGVPFRPRPHPIPSHEETRLHTCASSMRWPLASVSHDDVLASKPNHPPRHGMTQRDVTLHTDCRDTSVSSYPSYGPQARKQDFILFLGALFPTFVSA